MTAKDGEEVEFSKACLCEGQVWAFLASECLQLHSEGWKVVEGPDVHNAGDSEEHFDAGLKINYQASSTSPPPFLGNEHVWADGAGEMVVQLPGPGFILVL